MVHSSAISFAIFYQHENSMEIHSIGQKFATPFSASFESISLDRSVQISKVKASIIHSKLKINFLSPLYSLVRSHIKSPATSQTATSTYGPPHFTLPLHSSTPIMMNSHGKSAPDKFDFD